MTWGDPGFVMKQINLGSFLVLTFFFFFYLSWADGHGLVHCLAGGYDFLQMDIVLNKVLSVAKECTSPLHFK